MRVDIAQQITQKIIEALEKGTTPWIKPWTGGGADHNIASKKPYRGINTILLALEAMAGGYTSTTWGTYKQFAEKKIQVKKGEKAAHIVFFKSVKGTGEVNQETGVKDKGFAILRGYSVFNADQTDMPKPEAVEGVPFDPNPACEAFIEKAGVPITYGGGRACYIPSKDKIRLPARESFDAPVHFYNTAFHELTHATGHKKRLARVITGSFGDASYAYEELVAEMGAAFLCNIHGIQAEMQHADYIGNWLEKLKGDKRFVLKAASAAQKAVDWYIPPPKREEAMADE